MDNPPKEVYETSWRQAKDVLEALGPEGAFLLVTATLEERGDGDDGGQTGLASKVILSSGEQRIPASYVLEILDVHLGGA